MITRIVKMTFHSHRVNGFLDVFSKCNSQIRQFPGCSHLELLQDENNPSIFFTLSRWASQNALERYRQSALFTKTWAAVKEGFSTKPEAWTLSQKKV